MKLQWILVGVVVAVFVIGVWGLRPVPQPTEENMETVIVEVADIRATESFDIFFDVRDHEHEQFYINRGVEQGFDAEALKRYLQEKQVALTYVKHRSLFDPGGRVHHLVKVSCGDSLIFAQ